MRGGATRPVGRSSRPLSLDPEPPAVTAGRSAPLRRARRDAATATGNIACASCHVFGHADQLAWDLGDPSGSLAYYYPDIMDGVLGFTRPEVTAPDVPASLHPMKGPMVTQSLRGLPDPATKDGLPLHWRGDRRCFHMFRGAFAGCSAAAASAALQMQEFAGFVRTHAASAPNPRQPKDRAVHRPGPRGPRPLRHEPARAGQGVRAVPGSVPCITCHTGDFTERDRLHRQPAT